MNCANYPDNLPQRDINKYESEIVNSYYNDGDNLELYRDNGSGIPVLNKDNIGTEDIRRYGFLFTQESGGFNKVGRDLERLYNQQPTEVSNLFFSKENIDRIQAMIKLEIKKQTNGKIILESDQDINDLTGVMSGVYENDSYYLPTQIVRQVKKLNAKVISIVVPDMLTNIKQYYNYRKDIETGLKPIPRGNYTSISGTKSLTSNLTSTYNI